MGKQSQYIILEIPEFPVLEVKVLESCISGRFPGSSQKMGQKRETRELDEVPEP